MKVRRFVTLFVLPPNTRTRQDAGETRGLWREITANTSNTARDTTRSRLVNDVVHVKRRDGRQDARC